eukprot:snap_masked-scaffold_3-processed-gene-11.35-mRNA-1 protein AED:1.00 eAED:1.00 QI:0/0/0/0/1/1/2/0/88
MFRCKGMCTSSEESPYDVSIKFDTKLILYSFIVSCVNIAGSDVEGNKLREREGLTDTPLAQVTSLVHERFFKYVCENAIFTCDKKCKK